MSFDWIEYLNLAKKLLEEKDSDAALRSAISRAYYCAFNKARSYLDIRLGIVVNDKYEGHKKVWDKFKEQHDKSLKSVGSNGDRLRDERRESDYEHTGKSGQQLLLKAKNAVQMAESILKKIQ